MAMTACHFKFNACTANSTYYKFNEPTNSIIIPWPKQPKYQKPKKNPHKLITWFTNLFLDVVITGERLFNCCRLNC